MIKYCYYTEYSLCRSARGGKYRWQKFVLAKMNLLTPLLSVSSVHAQGTAFLLKFVKESITKSLR